MQEITIPDDLYERLKAAADHLGRSVDDLLYEAIERVTSTRGEEISRLRNALGDDLENHDHELAPPHLQPYEAPVDHAVLRASMPILDPPLSQTVISERDERV